MDPTDDKFKAAFIRLFNQGFEEVVLPHIEHLDKNNDTHEHKIDALTADTKQLQDEMGVIKDDLKNIKDGMSEIKNDLKGTKHEVSDIKDDLKYIKAGIGSIKELIVKDKRDHLVKHHHIVQSEIS